MKISVFGMGYVGCVSAGCLAKMGNDIVAVEPVQTKIDKLNEGKSPIIEKELDEYIEWGVELNKIHATSDFTSAVQSTEMAMVCVGHTKQYQRKHRYKRGSACM